MSIMNEFQNYLKKGEFHQFVKVHNGEHDKIANKFKVVDGKFEKKDQELAEVGRQIQLRAMNQEFKDHVEYSKVFALNKDLSELKSYIYPMLENF